MRVAAKMTIDCTAGSTEIEVSAVVPDDGQDELDATMYEAMLRSLRLMAEAARREQREVTQGEERP